MKSLLVVAHGSKRVESNDEVLELVNKMSNKNEVFSEIAAAFLEFATPSITDGIKQLIENGASHVIVLPYFLSAGNHVIKDIPEEVSIIQKEYPHIKISIAPYLGAADEITNILLKQAKY